MAQCARIVVALTFGAALVLAAGCSSPSTPGSPPATTTTARPVACSRLFRVGAPVTADLAKKPCTTAAGIVSAQHFFSCHDGRTMILDRDSDVYGFAGGTFAVSDTAADSQYAKDFAACTGE